MRQHCGGKLQIDVCRTHPNHYLFFLSRKGGQGWMLSSYVLDNLQHTLQ